MAQVITFGEFAKKLTRAGPEMRKEAREQLSASGRFFKQTASRNARTRFRRSSGDTAKSPRAHLEGGNKLRMLFGLRTDIAPGGVIQDTGGTIHAKAGGWLYFRLPDGTFRRVKKVTIRGTRWLSDANVETQRYTSERLRELLPTVLAR